MPLLRARPDAADRRQNVRAAPAVRAHASRAMRGRRAAVRRRDGADRQPEPRRRGERPAGRRVPDAPAGSSRQQRRRTCARTGTRLVVGDIPPLAFAAAARGGHPVDRDRQFHMGLDLRRRIPTPPPTRARARHPARLPRCHPRPAPADGRRLRRARIDHARHPLHRPPVAARRRTTCATRSGLPPRAAGKPLVLMSFGGYGVAGLDTAALADLTDYTIATTDLSARRQRDQAGARTAVHLRAAAVRRRAAL